MHVLPVRTAHHHGARPQLSVWPPLVWAAAKRTDSAREVVRCPLIPACADTQVLYRSEPGIADEGVGWQPSAAEGVMLSSTESLGGSYFMQAWGCISLREYC